jgi:hypothetical protein
MVSTPIHDTFTGIKPHDRAKIIVRFGQGIVDLAIPEKRLPFFHLWLQHFLDFCATTGFPDSSSTSLPLLLSLVLVPDAKPARSPLDLMEEEK